MIICSQKEVVLDNLSNYRRGERFFLQKMGATSTFEKRHLKT